MARVIAVAGALTHQLAKTIVPAIKLVAGLGVEGDAHFGMTTKHQSHVRKDPKQPNLRQVHLIHAELFEELTRKGYEIGPGVLGENLTTRGLMLLDLPKGVRLHVGPDAIVELTGLRNPCRQLDAFKPGLAQALLDKDQHGELVRKAGVMGVVLAGGTIKAGDEIRVELPEEPFSKMAPV